MRTSPRLWRYHLIYWSLAGSALFVSGLTQAPFEVVFVRNVYLTTIGLLLGLPLLILLDRTAVYSTPVRLLATVPGFYGAALGATVLINPVTFDLAADQP